MNIYLITCIKKYPPYTGDTLTGTVRFIVPAIDEVAAKQLISSNIDEIKTVKKLYEVDNIDSIKVFQVG